LLALWVNKTIVSTDQGHHMATHYKSRYASLSGSHSRELYQKAHAAQRALMKSSRRKAYVRSKFFKLQKVFLDTFWIHLSQKNSGERRRRIAFFVCALDLIKNTTNQPTRGL
jgi:hypothetical protein